MNIQEQKLTVWKELNANDKSVTKLASSYEGKDQNDKAIYSQWVTRFVGTALKLGKKLDEKDRIIVTNGKVENQYDKSKGYSTAVITVFEFKMDKEL